MFLGMTDWTTSHLEILVKMYSADVTGKHHKQRDTIKRWANLEGDKFTEAMDELVTDPVVPVAETARETVGLTDMNKAEEFIREHDTEGEYTWHLERE